MNKILTGTTAAILAVTMAGCQKRPEAPVAPTEEPVVEATPEATPEVEAQGAMIAQGSWQVNQFEHVERESEDAGRLMQAIESINAELVDPIASRETAAGNEYMYLIYDVSAEGEKTWAIASVIEDTEGRAYGTTTSIDLSAIPYVNPADKNLGEHPAINTDWTFYNTGKSAVFSIEDFRITADEVLAKAGVNYVPEVFLGEGLTGNGFVVLARHVDEKSNVVDYHIIEIARSGEFNETGPVDEFDLTYDEVVDLSKYAFGADPAEQLTEPVVAEAGAEAAPAEASPEATAEATAN